MHSTCAQMTAVHALHSELQWLQNRREMKSRHEFASDPSSFRTGVPCIDHLLENHGLSLRHGTLIEIAGPTGSGKTWLLRSIAAQILSDHICSQQRIKDGSSPTRAHVFVLTTHPEDFFVKDVVGHAGTLVELTLSSPVGGVNVGDMPQTTIRSVCEKLITCVGVQSLHDIMTFFELLESQTVDILPIDAGSATSHSKGLTRSSGEGHVPAATQTRVVVLVDSLSELWLDPLEFPQALSATHGNGSHSTNTSAGGHAMRWAAHALHTSIRRSMARWNYSREAKGSDRSPSSQLTVLLTNGCDYSHRIASGSTGSSQSYPYEVRGGYVWVSAADVRLGLQLVEEADCVELQQDVAPDVSSTAAANSTENENEHSHFRFVDHQSGNASVRVLGSRVVVLRCGLTIEPSPLPECLMRF